MKNEIIFRSFCDKDYEIICKWWDFWWGKETQIERDVLPGNDYCFIIEKNNTPIASIFLYVDKNAPVGYLTYMVSNPEYREKDRRIIIEQLILDVESKAKSEGLKFIFTVCGNVHMENIHSKLGWTVDKTAPAYETFKYI